MSSTPPHLSAATAPDCGALRHFYLWHALVPLALVLLISAVLMGLGGDFWIADLIYRWEGYQWALRDVALTRSVIHHDGKLLSCAAWAMTAVLALWSWRHPDRRRYRWPLLYLLLAVGLGTGVASLLKSLTDMDCPWDLTRYGGEQLFIGLFEPRPANMPRGVCFPAGHASAGYAWVALYFAALALKPCWRWPALALGLGAGLLFGIGQQLRGAHFMSHDLWTLALCWGVALVLYRALLWPRTSLPQHACPTSSTTAEKPTA
ncbi:phosphatase PAP2 family protein [Xanthomonas albilineans]|uniref:phosphatase PAP2 family protein n=1 Tax=Xanthomonas albilineans TaxID=29447 RepID=UPI0005F3142A|nr:phosphatase PAP2 family protein [Xanthomonas albilineans]PPU93270.1 phosphatase PAP2 family protein [Xanthomonas albilineans]